MSNKFTTFLMILVQSIISKASQQSIVGNIYADNPEFDCNYILSSMNFLYNERCVQFIFGHELHSGQCVKTIIENRLNVTFYMRSLSWLTHRNIYEEESISSVNKKHSTRSCENFLIVLKDVNALQSVLKFVNTNQSIMTMFPYSKLYFIVPELLTPATFIEISKFFHENPQFGYVYEFHANTSTIKLRHFLALNNGSAIQSNLVHPIVNRQNNQKEFRLTFYDCYPFAIYMDEENLRFDGIEYRLIRLVTKNWKIKHILRDESKTGISPWITMFDDLKDHTADLALCSIWASDFDTPYDVSTYYNHECNTLMVPKPEPLSEITVIYRTLSRGVWLTFSFFFVAMGMLLWGSAMISIDVTRRVHVNIGRAFLDVMNIATLHGADNFLVQQGSTKVLLMSWILGSFLVGICYTTIYASLLAKPGFSKLINTVEDFVRNDMYWGTFHFYQDAVTSLIESSIPAYHELNQRTVIFKNRLDAQIGLASGKFGVYAVYAGISNAKYFVTYDWNEHLHLLESFRLMKKICIFNFYTVFALQKFSPYTELFSRYALLFQEYGITQFWFSTVYSDKTSFHKFFEDYPQQSNEPAALNFANISGALSVLFVSHTVSVGVFICELAVKHFKSIKIFLF